MFFVINFQITLHLWKKYHLCLSIPINSLCAHVVPLLFVPTRCVACFPVGAQSIVERFDSFLCPC